jgi:hypothetical protein
MLLSIIKRLLLRKSWTYIIHIMIFLNQIYICNEPHRSFIIILTLFSILSITEYAWYLFQWEYHQSQAHLCHSLLNVKQNYWKFHLSHPSNLHHPHHSHYLKDELLDFSTSLILYMLLKNSSYTSSSN